MWFELESQSDAKVVFKTSMNAECRRVATHKIDTNSTGPAGFSMVDSVSHVLCDKTV